MKTYAEYARNWRAKNRKKYNKMMRDWREKNPDRSRELAKANYSKRKQNGKDREHRRKYLLKTKYGITPADYQSKLDKQGGVCAVCKQPETSLRRGTFKSLDVDHNHTTGQVRGLLCSACNAALGLLREDPERIMSLVAYIQLWSRE